MDILKRLRVVSNDELMFGHTVNLLHEMFEENRCTINDVSDRLDYYHVEYEMVPYKRVCIEQSFVKIPVGRFDIKIMRPYFGIVHVVHTDFKCSFNINVKTFEISDVIAKNVFGVYFFGTIDDTIDHLKECKLNFDDWIDQYRTHRTIMENQIEHMQELRKKHETLYKLIFGKTDEAIKDALTRGRILNDLKSYPIENVHLERDLDHDSRATYALANSFETLDKFADTTTKPVPQIVEITYPQPNVTRLDIHVEKPKVPSSIDGTFSQGTMIQLMSLGAQDRYLTINPEVSFFKQSYKRYTNFAVENYDEYFSTNFSFGQTNSCVLQKHGDLVGNMSLRIVLPNLNIPGGTWADTIGYKVFKVARLRIGDLVVQDHERLWYDIDDKLFCDETKIDGLNRLIKRGQTLSTNQTNELIVPLKFFCCKRHTAKQQFIPVFNIATNVVVEFDIDSISNLVTIPAGYSIPQVTVDATVLVDNIFLEDNEKFRFAQSKSTYIVDQNFDMENVTYKISNSGTTNASEVNIDLKELNKLTKYFAIVAYDQDDTNFTYTNVIDSGTMYIGSNQQFNPRKSMFFSHVQPYQHFKRITPNVSTFSLCLDASVAQPNGAFDFSSVVQTKFRFAITPQTTAKKIKIFANGTDSRDPENAAPSKPLVTERALNAQYDVTPSNMVRKYRKRAERRWREAQIPKESGIITPDTRPAEVMPFFRSGKSMNTNPSVSQRTMELYTGNMLEGFSEAGGYRHKVEQENMFGLAPQGRVTSGGTVGNPGGNPELEKARTVNSKLHNNVLPSEQLRVGPGLAAGPEIAATGGFHQFYRQLPLNINEYKLTQLPGVLNHGASSVQRPEISQIQAVNHHPGELVLEYDERPPEATTGAFLGRKMYAREPRGYAGLKPYDSDYSGIAEGAVDAQQARFIDETRGRMRTGDGDTLPNINLSGDRAGIGGYVVSDTEPVQLASQRGIHNEYSGYIGPGSGIAETGESRPMYSQGGPIRSQYEDVYYTGPAGATGPATEPIAVNEKQGLSRHAKRAGQERGQFNPPGRINSFEPVAQGLQANKIKPQYDALTKSQAVVPNNIFISSDGQGNNERYGSKSVPENPWSTADSLNVSKNQLQQNKYNHDVTRRLFDDPGQAFKQQKNFPEQWNPSDDPATEISNMMPFWYQKRANKAKK